MNRNIYLSVLSATLLTGCDMSDFKSFVTLLDNSVYVYKEVTGSRGEDMFGGKKGYVVLQKPDVGTVYAVDTDESGKFDEGDMLFVDEDNDQKVDAKYNHSGEKVWPE
jgi:hypothetical protein